MKNINNYILEKFKISKDIKDDDCIRYVVCWCADPDGYDIRNKIFNNEEEARNFSPGSDKVIDAIFICDENLIKDLLKRWSSLPLREGPAHKKFREWLKENNIKSLYY